MPQNTDKRCVGITLVAEALLAGRSNPATLETVEQLAERIYSNLTNAESLAYPSQLLMGDRGVDIDSREGLTALTDAVANRYKQQYFGDIATQAGQERLWNAIDENIVKSITALRTILTEDADHMQAFFGIGHRRFENDELKETWHAFLIGLEPEGQFYVLDPNEWGKRHICELREAEERMLIAWTCQYRDTGKITSQEYQIATKRVLLESP